MKETVFKRMKASEISFIAGAKIAYNEVWQYEISDQETWLELTIDIPEKMDVPEIEEFCIQRFGRPKYDVFELSLNVSDKSILEINDIIAHTIQLVAEHYQERKITSDAASL